MTRSWVGGVGTALFVVAGFTATLVACGGAIKPQNAAVDSGAPVSAMYTITGMPPPPPIQSIAPTLTALNGTTQNNDFVVAATDSDATVTICFTIDGSTPVCSAGACQGTSQEYDAATQVPVNASVTNPVTGSVTISAVACGGTSNLTSTAVTTLTATLQTAVPTMVNPAPGNQPVTSAGYAPTITSATTPSTPSAVFVIRYTLAPAPLPTCAVGTIAVGPPSYVDAPISCTGGVSAGCASDDAGTGYDSTQTFQVIACKTGYASSPVVSFTYTD